MPGVTVTTSTRSGPVGGGAPNSGQYFAVGICERGDTAKAVLVRSMTEFERLFGTRQSYGSLYDDVRTFFEEGGSRAWIARVVGPAASIGTLSLVDRSGGAGLATLRVDAQNAGAWATGLTVEVRDGTTPNTFRLLFALGALVEDYNNLTDPAAAVQQVNATSALVRLAALANATAAPGNNPMVVAPSALVGGTDDRASVTDAMRVAALARFTPDLGDGAVAIPGSTGATVWTGLDAAAKAGRRVAILAGARGDTVSGLTTAAATMNTEYAGLFAPWILVPDGAGGQRAVSPEGYVAACRARAHEEGGPFRAPGGELAKAAYVVGVDQAFSRAEGDALDLGRVNAIRVIASTIRLYGWRSLSQDEANYSMLTGRDALNRLVVEGEKRLEQFVFRPIDSRGQLLSAIAGELIGMVQPYSGSGLYERRDADGAVLDPGYRVQADSELNPLEQLARNEVRARVSVRVAPTGALITLNIVKAGVTAAI